MSKEPVNTIVRILAVELVHRPFWPIIRRMAHWTAANIRDLADRMAARPNGFRVSPETAELVIEAIRLYAREHACGPFRAAYTLDVWDKAGDAIEEHVAQIGLFEVGRAAFRATCLARPDKFVTLRQGIRVVMSSDRQVR